jgi:hypothetical protein
MIVQKDADGRYRWTAVSSTSYQDRDGEIVSLKALTDDVARTDRTGKLGPLLWWHTPLKLGDTDSALIYEKSLIESGTFKSERLGQAIMERGRGLEVSLGFTGVKSARDGVWHQIERFERSLLPAGKAAALGTSFRVSYKAQPQLDKPKLDALRALVPDDLIEELLAEIDAMDEQAERAGARYRQRLDPPADPEIESALGELRASSIALTQTTGAAAIAQCIRALRDEIDALSMSQGPRDVGSSTLTDTQKPLPPKSKQADPLAVFLSAPWAASASDDWRLPQ